MIITTRFNSKTVQADLSKPIDISLPLKQGTDNPNAWWAGDVKFEPVRMGSFIGDTLQGGSVNYKNVFFNPHGNGTHTECVGHISKNGETINQSLKQFHFFAQLISAPLSALNNDEVIAADALDFSNLQQVSALIVRSMPNGDDKRTKKYTGNNPPYFTAAAMEKIVGAGIEHLLTDLPSVDREQDEGKLQGHNIFWNTAGAVRKTASITEMVYVPPHVSDGIYLLNMQIPSFELDAAPSKILMYALSDVSKAIV